jgi:hypothetical protein
VAGIAVGCNLISGHQSLTASVPSLALCCYPIDEATSGQGPTELVDTLSPALSLPITYSGANPAFVTSAQGQGLLHTTAAPVSGANAPIAGSKVLAAIHGSKLATLEVVLTVSATMFSGGTGAQSVFGINTTDAEEDRLSLYQWGEGCYFDFEGAGGYPGDYWYLSMIWSQVVAGPGRYVVHCVLDTTQAVAANRMKFYVDGVLKVPFDRKDPPLNKSISLNGLTDYLGVGSFHHYDGNFTSTVWFAALYAIALPQVSVTARAAALALDNNLHG